jgi:hypothetical protein
LDLKKHKGQKKAAEMKILRSLAGYTGLDKNRKRYRDDKLNINKKAMELV